MTDLPTKAATDIKYYNGSVWVSVKTNKVKVHNGSVFVNANTPKIHYKAGDYWYFIKEDIFFNLVELIVVLTSQNVVKTIWYNVAPKDSIVVVKQKPTYLEVTINPILNEITIGSIGFQENQTGLVVLSCSNGAPDITLQVIQGSRPSNPDDPFLPPL